MMTFVDMLNKKKVQCKTARSCQSTKNIYVLTKLKKLCQDSLKTKNPLFPNQKRTNPAAFFFFGTRLNSVFWTPVPVWSGIRLQDSKKRAMDVTQRKPGGCGPNTWKAKMGEFFVKKTCFLGNSKKQKTMGFPWIFFAQKMWDWLNWKLWRKRSKHLFKV